MNRWSWLIPAICVVYLKPNASVPPSGPPYTHETCKLKCHTVYGFATYHPPMEKSQSQTIPVAIGQVMNNGNSCPCYPTNEIMNKVAAVVRTLAPFADFVRHSPEASKAFLYLHNFYVEFPISKVKDPISKTGTRNWFGLKKNSGVSSTSKAPALPPPQLTGPVFRPADDSRLGLTVTQVQHPSMKTPATSSSLSLYTDETCNLECQQNYGRAAANPIPIGTSRIRTIAVTFGQTTRGGSSCNCYPTKEILDKLAPIVALRPATFMQFFLNSPEASKAFLELHNFQVEFPIS